MNRYLEKIAQMSEDHKSDLVNTGVLGAVGGIESVGLAKAFNHPRLSKIPAVAKIGIGAGVTLGADYAGLKLGKAINKLRGAPSHPNKE